MTDPHSIHIGQAVMRLVPLDSEGNPKEGEGVTFGTNGMITIEPEEDHLMSHSLRRQTVSMEFTVQDVDKELFKLLTGEEYGTVADSAPNRRWYHVLRDALRGLLAKVKGVFQ